MAAGSLFAVLKSIPWAEVVANAPAIAAAARRLWTMARQRGEPSPDAMAGEETPDAAAQSAHDALLVRLQHAQAQVDQLHARVDALQAQLRESSELIRALADQNEQLVARVELNRRRLIRLAWLGAAMAIAMATVLAQMWLQGG